MAIYGCLRGVNAMSEGLIPSDSYLTGLKSVCKKMTTVSVSNSNSSDARRVLPTTPLSPSDIGRKRAREFLAQELESGSPAKKSRRLEILNELQTKEKERMRVINRIDKNKQRFRELLAAIETDETRRAELEKSIRELKLEKC